MGSAIRIGGFQKLTLVDFPGKVAAIIFTQGCNFRCGWCHNPELVLPQCFQKPIDPQEILSFLASRKGKLEGVVISGGEPTIQPGLADFISQIKSLGFAIKLDTNGSHPEVLASLLEKKLLGFIAMDIKAPLNKYHEITGVDCDTEKLKQSITLIVNSGTPHQLRTTVIKDFHSQEDLSDIAGLIKNNHYILQSFVPSVKLVNPSWQCKAAYDLEEMTMLKRQFEKNFLKVMVLCWAIVMFLTQTKVFADGDYQLPRQEVLTGIGFSKVHHDGKYKSVPLFWDVHFDIKRYFSLLHPPGRADFIWEPMASDVYQPRQGAEIGNNFLVEWDFLPTHYRWQPYFKGGLGLIFLTNHFPSQSTQFNFNEYGGVGVHFFLNSRTALSLEYRFRHLSNASIRIPNNGINTYFALLGISLKF